MPAVSTIFSLLVTGIPCPNGWSQAQVKELANIVGGSTPDRGDDRCWQGGDIPWVTPTDITAQKVKYLSQTADKITLEGLGSGGIGMLPAGTVLYTSRATIGEKSIAAVPVTTNQGFANFIPQGLESEFLFYLLDLLTKVFRRLGSGTTFPEVSKRDIKRVACFIPPPPEQTRITETLKAADDHIRALEEQIRKAERMKKALLQSILVFGLPGRSKTPQTFRWGVAPAGWTENSIRGIITEPVGNGTSPDAARQEPPGFPTLNVSSIRNGRCDQTKISYIELPEKAVADFAVAQGDFFVLRGNGNRDFVAIGGLLIEEPQTGLVFSDLLIRLRFDKSKALPEFMKYLWQSPPFLRRLQSYAVTGSGLWKIGQRSISRLKLAVPSDIGEQKDIAAIFDAQEELLLSLGTQLTAARRVKQSLLQNLLTGKIRLKP